MITTHSKIIQEHKTTLFSEIFNIICKKNWSWDWVHFFFLLSWKVIIYFLHWNFSSIDCNFSNGGEKLSKSNFVYTNFFMFYLYFFFLVAGGFLETRPINSLNKVTNKRKSTTNTMFTATVTSSTPPLNNHTSLCLSGKIYFHHFFLKFLFQNFGGKFK